MKYSSIVTTMRLAAGLAGLAVTLSGCQTYSDGPSQSRTFAGDYQALADCYYLARANPRGFSKVDLPSLKTVTITMGSADVTTMRIDFVGIAPGRTEVRGHMNGLAFGESMWKDTVKTIEGCPNL